MESLGQRAPEPEADRHDQHAETERDAPAEILDLRFAEDLRETEAHGLELARSQQWELGRQVRALLVERGFASVAGKGFEAPGVVVSYTSDPEIQSAKKFVDLGLQAAAGVPLQCDEPADFRSFRIGLFGLDKLGNVERTVATLRQALDRLA